MLFLNQTLLFLPPISLSAAFWEGPIVWSILVQTLLGGFNLKFAKDLGCWGTLLLLSGFKHTLNQHNLVFLGRGRACS